MSSCLTMKEHHSCQAVSMRMWVVSRGFRHLLSSPVWFEYCDTCTFHRTFCVAKVLCFPVQYANKYYELFTLFLLYFLSLLPLWSYSNHEKRKLFFIVFVLCKMFIYLGYISTTSSVPTLPKFQSSVSYCPYVWTLFQNIRSLDLVHFGLHNMDCFPWSCVCVCLCVSVYYQCL